uniref:Uncharacterized protein n=1 Tax=Salix viminalis TaxID=40686 RepID=A0A6N2KMI9_SALVM
MEMYSTACKEALSAKKFERSSLSLNSVLHLNMDSVGCSIGSALSFFKRDLGFDPTLALVWSHHFDQHFTLYGPTPYERGLVWVVDMV